jgi:hypothetical protein
LKPDGEFIYPEHIMQALFDDVGLAEGDPADLRVDPLAAILKDA